MHIQIIRQIYCQKNALINAKLKSFYFYLLATNHFLRGILISCTTQCSSCRQFINSAKIYFLSLLTPNLFQLFDKSFMVRNYKGLMSSLYSSIYKEALFAPYFISIHLCMTNAILKINTSVHNRRLGIMHLKLDIRLSLFI